jgi:palmitoyltransferase
MASGYEGSRRPRRPCARCFSAVKWLPVILIFAVIAWSYYVYVFQICFLTVTNHVQRVLYLVGYHTLFAFFLWAYSQTVFTKIGKVPDKFKLPRAEMLKLEEADSEEAERQILKQFAQGLPITNRTATGLIRYCKICQHIKPDRAHHCSVCGECVLKMDHHCPWTNNCVAYTTYKFFIIFLGYAFLYNLFIAFTTLSPFIKWLEDDLQEIDCIHVICLFFAAVTFSLTLFALLCYYFNLVLRNRSTLETLRAPVFRTGPDKDGFNLGKYNNFREVFGENRMTWFLPIFTSLGDGSDFPVRDQHHISSVITTPWAIHRWCDIPLALCGCG